MKTEDMMQWALVALIAFLAYKKYGNTSNKLPPDFGLNNPNDSTWGDGS
jgi:hypothetical protein